MPAAFEGRGQPQCHDLIGEGEADDATADRQHVGIIVLTRHPRGVEIVAERRADPANLVGGHLFSLATAANHNSPVHAAGCNRPRHLGGDFRVIHRLVGEGSSIVDVVTEAQQRGDQVLLQREARVIRADGDAHMEDYKGATGHVLWRSRRMAEVKVNRRGEERVQFGHLWIYRSDVTAVDAQPGETVRVVGSHGRVLGHALYSSRSEIALRLITRGEQPADLTVWRSRIEQAVAYRQTLGIDATAYRLVHGEADLMPSFVVDRYADYLVVQTLSQGTDRLLADLTGLLVECVRPLGVVARNDPRVRELEGLDRRVEVLHGSVPSSITVREGRVTYEVDVYKGQKTGLFLDQRENRIAAAQYARGRLLDAFSYNGGFALAMAPACEEVLAIDISEDAVARIRGNAERNGEKRIEARAMNVFDELRELERRGEQFDTIVLDPPAFAKNKASLPKALSGYKEINLRALKILRPGGFLITCTCSYQVSEAAFAEVIASAAIDARADVVVVEKRMQARDHPVLITVPETYYLKCFIVRKLT